MESVENTSVLPPSGQNLPSSAQHEKPHQLADEAYDADSTMKSYDQSLEETPSKPQAKQDTISEKDESGKVSLEDLMGKNPDAGNSISQPLNQPSHPEPKQQTSADQEAPPKKYVEVKTESDEESNALKIDSSNKQEIPVKKEELPSKDSEKKEELPSKDSEKKEEIPSKNSEKKEEEMVAPKKEEIAVPKKEEIAAPKKEEEIAAPKKEAKTSKESDSFFQRNKLPSDLESFLTKMGSSSPQAKPAKRPVKPASFYEFMSPQKESDSFGGHKSNVFQRLYTAQKKRPASPEPEFVPTRSGPRNKIEFDLMERDKLTKAKLRAKAAEERAKQEKEFTGIPKINAKSKRILAGEVFDSDLEVKTVAKSYHRQKKANLSRDNTSVSYKDVKVNLSKFMLNSTSIQAATVHTEDRFMEFIKSRMSNSPPKIEEHAPEEPRYLEDEPDVVKRTLYWKRKKDERIQKQRDAKKGNELDGCTFKPTTNRNKNTKSNSVAEMPEQGKINRNLSPSNRRVGYASGFDAKTFVSKAQPMLGYKDIANIESG